MKQIFFAPLLALVFGFSALAQSTISNCAKIEVTGGGVVEPGTRMTFTVNVTGATKDTTLEYEWKISSGTIASGLGTPTIEVDMTGLANGTNVTAEVKIKGLYDNCPDTASETGSTTHGCGGLPPLSDEFAKLPRNEVRARVDALFIALKDKPNNQIYIINYGTDAEIAAREKLIRDRIAARKYDANRLTFINGGANPNGEGILTKAWSVPPGADAPQP